MGCPAKGLTFRFVTGIVDFSPVLCQQFFKVKPIFSADAMRIF